MTIVNNDGAPSSKTPAQHIGHNTEVELNTRSKDHILIPLQNLPIRKTTTISVDQDRSAGEENSDARSLGDVERGRRVEDMI
jgi:hypothetical protein